MQRLDLLAQHLHGSRHVYIEKHDEIGLLRFTGKHAAAAVSARAELLRALRTLEDDPGCAIVVLLLDVDGAVARDLVADDAVVGPSAESPSPAQVAAAVEGCAKVVVAVLCGVCVSGALELALAAAYRVASADAHVVFADLELGVVPRAGGTRRLVRRVGVRAALALLLTCRDVSAAAALRMGLVDALVDCDTLSARDQDDTSVALPCVWTVVRQLAHAHKSIQPVTAGLTERNALLPSTPYGVPPSLLLPCHLLLVAWARRLWREHAPRHGSQGVLHLTHAVQLTLHHVNDPRRAMARDEALYAHCVRQPEARAARHLLSAAEALAARGATLASSSDRTVRHVVVVGGGECGVRVTVLLLLRLDSDGVRVTMMTPDVTDAKVARAHVARYLDLLRCAPARCARVLSRLTLLDTPCTSLASHVGVLEADVVIECAETLPLATRLQWVRALDGVCCRDCVLVTTCVTQCALRDVAACTTRPSRTVGLYLYAPVFESVLAEVITDVGCGQEGLARVVRLLRQLQKPAVVRAMAGRCVGVRLLLAGLYQAYAMLEEGCYPYTVDRTLRRHGHLQLGLFELADAVGLVGLAHARAGWPGERPSRAVYDVVDGLVRDGHVGRAVGRGFYRYAAHDAVHVGWRGWNPMSWGRALCCPDTLCPQLATPYAAPRYHGAVDARVRECSAAHQLHRRELTETEVVERVVLAMTEEAARVLEKHEVGSAAEMDCVSVLGLGFPAFRGGVCYDADTRYGAEGLRRQLQLYHEALSARTFAAPSTTVLTMSQTGSSFATRFKGLP